MQQKYIFILVFDAVIAVPMYDTIISQCHYIIYIRMYLLVINIISVESRPLLDKGLPQRVPKRPVLRQLHPS
jgi:hypothetical protein